jgi:ubiquinone/menaquinone biosynthesis C-methylase UbiE
MQNDKPIALEAYENLAERYSQIAESKAENGYIDHPAMRKQIGLVQGLNILDAGCGPGILASFLIANGATVTGFDLSPKMIDLARQRTKNNAKFFVADMARPIPDLNDSGFDLVVSSLAIDYVRDWKIPLREFHRVLKPNGRLIFSVQHPMAAFNWYKPSTAFGVHYVEATWRGFGGEPVVVPDYYRSFEEMINPLVSSGFSITKIADTKPIEELKKIDLERFEKFNRQPTFMVIEACRVNQR